MRGQDEAFRGGRLVKRGLKVKLLHLGIGDPTCGVRRKIKRLIKKRGLLKEFLKGRVCQGKKTDACLESGGRTGGLN